VYADGLAGIFGRLVHQLPGLGHAGMVELGDKCGQHHRKGPPGVIGEHDQRPEQIVPGQQEF
jgi:hypothetical protein